MKFPMSARELVEAVREALDQQTDEIGDSMRTKYLPDMVGVVLTKDPEIREAISGEPKLDLSELSDRIGIMLWSHPSSGAGYRYKEVFQKAGYSDKSAEIIATRLMNLSRFPLSVVTNLRHYRSAIIAVGNLVDPNALRDRYLSIHGAFSAHLDKFREEWPRKSKELGTRVLRSQNDLTTWLSDIEIFYAEVHLNYMIARRGSNQRGIETETPNGARAMAKAFTRRFGRFCNEEIDVFELGGRYTTGEDSISKQYDDLRELFSKSPTSIYEKLDEEFKRRQPRIRPVRTELFRNNETVQMGRFANKMSAYEFYLGHTLNLDGRELLIRATTDKLSSPLVNQFLKLFQLQMELDPNMKRFEATSSLQGETIYVALDQPRQEDSKYLKKFFAAYSK